MSSADGSIPLQDHPVDGNHVERELSKLFETNETDKTPFSRRLVNKRAPTVRDRNLPL
jgi:hypothetical protein